MTHQAAASLQSIVDKHQITLQSMHNHAVTKSQLAAKKIYNRESRNISQFIKEHLIFQRKEREKPTFFGSKARTQKRTRFGVTLRYEENQTLELEYQPTINNSLEPQKQMKSIGQLSIQSVSRQSMFKNSKKNLKSAEKGALKIHLFPPHEGSSSKANRPKGSPSQMFLCSKNHQTRNKSPTVFQSKPDIRRRVMTQFTGGSSREHIVLPTPEKRIQSYPNTTAIIVMSKQKMQRFMRTLHRVAWMAKFLRGKPEGAEKTDRFKEHMKQLDLDFDTSIHETDLNYMVSRRYNLLNYHMEDHYDKRRKQLDEHQSSVKRQRLASSDEYLLLDSLTKRSILTMINGKIIEEPMYHHRQKAKEEEPNQQQKQVHFNLPYAEFISERQTKTSIYRLASMSMPTCLRIAFSLYDKNHNGKVDQDDLLQAISLSRKMPQLQIDILLMAKVMFAPKRGRSPSRRKGATEKDGSQFLRSGGDKLLLSSIGDKNLVQDNVLFVRVGGDKLLNATMGLDQSSEASVKKGQQQCSEDESQSAINSVNNRFSLDKFYVFLKQRAFLKKEEVSISQERTISSLSFPAFCKAFRSRRPAIFYDMLHFLFGTQRQDFTEEAQAEQVFSQQPRKVQTKAIVEQSLQEKWNSRLKSTNQILQELLVSSQGL